MKTVKFKNKKNINIYKINIKNKILLAILGSVFLVVLIISKLSNYISFNLRDYLEAKVNKENLLILKNSFSYLKREDVNLDDLITVVKNSKEEIVEVEFKLKESTMILSNIVGYMNENLAEYNYLGYKLDVPIGFVSNNVLLRNLGPKIPIKVELGDVALGNVETVIKEFGINNVLIELHLKVSINVSVLYPFDTFTTSSSYDTLIASKIVNGVVPDFYNGVINSKSDSINLPINE